MLHNLVRSVYADNVDDAFEDVSLQMMREHARFEAMGYVGKSNRVET